MFDARVGLSMAVLDMHALNDNRAAQHNVEAAKYSYKSARELVVLVAADAYLHTMAAAARATSAHAQVETAQALADAGDRSEDRRARRRHRRAARGSAAEHAEAARDGFAE